MTLRNQGVYGADAPTKKSKTVEASDFLIGGLVGKFPRKYPKTFKIRSTEELRTIFGDNEVQTYYGWDGVQGFFDCAVGAEASLYVKSHVGNTGSAIDAVVALATLVDQASSPASTLKLEAAYQEELEYGVSGNRTGYTIENGTRFDTEAKAANIAAATNIFVDSVAGIKVGDIISCTASGGTPAVIEKKVTGIVESTGEIQFTGPFSGAAANMEIGDAIEVLGFRLRTWRSSLTGVVSEVDAELGKVWCTMEPEVGDFYVENVFSTSTWLKASDLSSVSVLGEAFPVDVTTVAYLLTGADGTTPTTIAQWNFDLQAFNADPIRMLCNVETTATDIQKAMETYSKGREDHPKIIYNIPESRTKDQLVTIGNNFQRSDDVMGVVVANWLEKTDPFVTSTLAPKRRIPSCAHVMGTWIRSISLLGIHWVPAVAAMPLFGVTGVVGETFTTGPDRTDLANAGINVIQDITGTGIVIKSFFTPSTAKEYRNANGILMREFIKISLVDSLATTENEPNSFERIQSSRVAAINFMHNLWEKGSTGNSARGETFGQSIDPATGLATREGDHYEVQADIINNPTASIENGERNLNVSFSSAVPTNSFKIAVGPLLLG